MTSTWKNKNDCWGRFNRSVVQDKKDVPEGSAKYPTLWTISQDEKSGRVGHHFHGQGCRKDTSSS